MHIFFIQLIVSEKNHFSVPLESNPYLRILIFLCHKKCIRFFINQSDFLY